MKHDTKDVHCFSKINHTAAPWKAYVVVKLEGGYDCESFLMVDCCSFCPPCHVGPPAIDAFAMCARRDRAARAWTDCGWKTALSG